MTEWISSRPVSTVRTTGAIVLASVFALAVGFGAASRVRLRTADTPRYERLARNLTKFGTYSSCDEVPLHPEIQRVPGYPVFLAGARKLGIRSDEGVARVQAILHAAAVLAVAGVAPRYRALSAWAFALYPYSLTLSLKLTSEGVCEFLLLFALFCWSLSAEAIRWRKPLIVLAGLLFSALSLTRPVFLLLPPAIAVAHAAWRRIGLTSPWTLKDVVLLVVVTVLPVLPWEIRTSRVAGRPLPLALNWVGQNLWLATWDYRVSTHDLEFSLLSPVDPRNEGVEIDLNEGDGAKNLAASDHARQIAVRRIKERPFRFLAESAWRTIRVWLTWEISEPEPQSPSWHIVSLALRWTSLLIFILALTGAWILRNQVEVALVVIVPIVYISVAHMTLHCSGRYSHPARALLIILACHVLGEVGERAWTVPKTAAGARDRMVN